MYELPEPYETFRQQLILRDAQNFLTPPSIRDVTRAKCDPWTQEFAKKFPELKRVPGFFKTEHQLAEIQGTEHWWLVTEDGTIIDPTRAQFMDGQEIYTVFDEKIHQVYLGRCPNCGSGIYGLASEGRQDFCDDECGEDYTRYLEREASRL